MRTVITVTHSFSVVGTWAQASRFRCRLRTLLDAGLELCQTWASCFASWDCGDVESRASGSATWDCSDIETQVSTLVLGTVLTRASSRILVATVQLERGLRPSRLGTVLMLRCELHALRLEITQVAMISLASEYRLCSLKTCLQ